MKCKEAFLQTDTDKGFSHGYDRFYDLIFNDYKPESLLEVGIKRGNSIAAWRLMFPECMLTGIDITDKSFQKDLIEFSKMQVIIGNSTEPEILEKLDKSYDVIIDDGSHYYKDIAKTFKNLHTKFNKYYIIEDWYYDLNMAKKFINKYGFFNVSFYKSIQSNIKVPEAAIFKTKRKTSITIDQNLIIIKR